MSASYTWPSSIVRVRLDDMKPTSDTFPAYQYGTTPGDFLFLLVPFLFDHFLLFFVVPFPSAWQRQVVLHVWLQHAALTAWRLFHSTI